MKNTRTILCSTMLLLGALLTAPIAQSAETTLRVFTTTTDLADMVRQVGGDRVSVTAMVKPREDPHFAQAKPSFIKELSVADLFVEVGLDLEIGYVPLLLANARNASVLPGASGFVDASRAITLLNIPTGTVDRSMGDLHPGGSPHYMLDPLRAFAVAELLAAKLSQLRPSDSDLFAANLDDFRERLSRALVGDSLASRYDAFKLSALAEKGALAGFLEQQGDRAALGGWLGAMLPLYGAPVVDDHPVWSYFAARFGLKIVGHLEPKPGIPPTTMHLKGVIDTMNSKHVRAVLASPYYDPRHAEFVGKATGATIAHLAHQTGGIEGTDDYIAMIDYNVRATVAALTGAALTGEK